MSNCYNCNKELCDLDDNACTHCGTEYCASCIKGSTKICALCELDEGEGEE